MRMNPLGRSGLMVSELCLGTMTFGTQTPEPEAHAQINLALERGVNFVDTAEMYPVNPVKAETIGRTEQIIGNWIHNNAARRDNVILATKHSGEGLSSVRIFQNTTHQKSSLNAQKHNLPKMQILAIVGILMVKYLQI